MIVEGLDDSNRVHIYFTELREGKLFEKYQRKEERNFRNYDGWFREEKKINYIEKLLHNSEFK